jgi:hypothetical protein
MSPSHRRTLHLRKFLNSRRYHGGAYVLADVSEHMDRWRDKRGEPHTSVTAYASLTIADCSRVVSLALDGESARERANTLRKLDLLIDTLTRLRAATASAFAREAASHRRPRPYRRFIRAD